MSQGLAALTVNGDIRVQAPGLLSSAVPVVGLRPCGLNLMLHYTVCVYCIVLATFHLGSTFIVLFMINFFQNIQRMLGAAHTVFAAPNTSSPPNSHNNNWQVEWAPHWQ